MIAPRRRGGSRRRDFPDRRNRGDGMSTTAISPHISTLRLAPPRRSQPVGGRDDDQSHPPITFAQTTAVAVVAAAPAALANPEWQQPAVVETPAPIVRRRSSSSSHSSHLAKLKPLFVEWFELRPKVRRAYDESSKAAGFRELGMNRTDERQEEAMCRFDEARRRTGYSPLWK
jgi:hypothetical protein